MSLARLWLSFRPPALFPSFLCIICRFREGEPGVSAQGIAQPQPPHAALHPGVFGWVFSPAIFNLHLLPIGSPKGMKHRGVTQTRGTLRPIGQVKRQDTHGAAPGCCHLGRVAPGHSPR